MKLAFFEYEDWMQEYVLEKLPEHEVVFVEEPLTEANAGEFADVQAVSVFVFSKVDGQVMEKMPALKLIAARSTGFDHISLEEAKKREITVTNVPRYGSITVAEHTFALILALSRMIYAGYERTEKVDFSLEGLRGFDLYGKTLGLVGLGEIGTQVAQISRGFGMKLRIFNRTRDEGFAASFTSCVYVDRIEDIFTHADIISFHVPLTPETYHLLNLDNYQTLKPGCVIINTARGPIIDTRALIKGLQEGIIGGAGLDVLESEGVIKSETPAVNIEKLPSEQELAETYLNHVLINMDHVVITPHNAFNSNESIRRLLDANLENVLNFFKGNLESLDMVDSK